VTCATISLVIQDSLRILQAEGYKITQPRKQVLEVLQASHEPLSPYEIQRLLRKQGKSINHVTVYRTLDLFCTLNLAHKILSSGGFVKCAIKSEEGCHRFVVCRRCGALQEFADEELCRQESKSARKLGFHTECHFSESSGLCADCYGKEDWKW
jgi:Fe2+ or Zn2+ uptake regulation protein